MLCLIDLRRIRVLRVYEGLDCAMCVPRITWSLYVLCSLSKEEGNSAVTQHFGSSLNLLILLRLTLCHPLFLRLPLFLFLRLPLFLFLRLPLLFFFLFFLFFLLFYACLKPRMIDIAHHACSQACRLIILQVVYIIAFPQMIALCTQAISTLPLHLFLIACTMVPAPSHFRGSYAFSRWSAQLSLVQYQALL
ncbi:hypothetical protein BJ878DRAFT_71737 [Calycina marina]|uniref:Uncharacterized protein n=1 Tax=Calycina marina TaxID=1763456 RepID=A0A9P7Z3W7_9HELO|nr:hypothetical protein BJ878DRAFT_71737 [Calycina marina]